MDQSRLSYLFQQYINKTCSTSELEEFMSVVKNSDEDDVLEMILDNFWETSTEVTLSKNKADKILYHAISTGKNQPSKKITTFTKGWLGWAAAVFIMGMVFLFINQKTEISGESGTKKHEITRKVKPSVTFITINATNEHRKVALPDGSSVILNDNSAVTFPKTFTRERTVTLTGEGYFDIKHNDKKSFTVYTGKLRTTVLGTAFNIKAYNKDKNIEVTVTRGKVGIIDNDKQIAILTPNQQVIFNKHDKKSNHTKVIAKKFVQWQESDVFFDDITMEEASQKLSTRFGKPISFENEEAKKCKFTATFLKGESLDEILKVICSFNNVQYQNTARGITIKGEGCK